jgi:DNA repair protein RadC
MVALQARWIMKEGTTLQYDGRLRGPQQVADLCRKHLEGEPCECFCVAYLNTQHQITHIETITRGILDAALVHPREVFRGAILANAAGLIMFHNHPSGDPTPSLEDRTVTKQIRRAGETVGIPLLDHVVVGSDSWVSLAESGGLGHV